MTVANLKKPTAVVCCSSAHDFFTSSNTPSRNVKRFDDDRSPKTIQTPEDSIASWIDADEGYRAVNFLDEASRILYGEDEDIVDVYHEQFRSEYEQWKKIPHLRIIGKRIGQSSIEKAQEDRKQIIVNTPTRTSPNVLRDRVVEIMTETIWQRLLSKIRYIENVHQKRRHMRQPGWSGSQRQFSFGQMESALIVSPILPTNRSSPQAFKSRTRLETINQSETAAYDGPLRKSNTKYEKISWPKSNVDTLPPINIYQKKPVDKTGKRWFSAVNAVDRNHTQPRPVTSVSTDVNNTGEINVCFNISINGKSIKNLRKKSRYVLSPS